MNVHLLNYILYSTISGVQLQWYIILICIILNGNNLHYCSLKNVPVNVHPHKFFKISLRGFTNEKKGI